MVESSSQIKDRLLAIGIEPKTVENILKNKAVVAKFEEVLDIAGIKECAKEKGALLYGLTTKGKALLKENLEIFVACLVQDKWTRMPQLDAGLDYVLQKTRNEGKGFIVSDMTDFEKETGVGVVVTQEQIDGFVDEIFKKHEAEIGEKKHDFNFASFLQTLRKDHKWADGGAVRNTIEAKKLALLGEPPKDEGGRKKKGKQSAEDKKKAKEEKKEETKEEPTIDIKQLIGRDVDVGNYPEVLAKHREATGNKIRTRFPPEPNGYLHIGHAKAIRFNFEVAKQYEGTTYLRFDDTNPDKENQEYIDHIKEIVSWLGYTPA
jgi:glutaminyl-tRNA synthetase